MVLAYVMVLVCVVLIVVVMELAIICNRHMVSITLYKSVAECLLAAFCTFQCCNFSGHFYKFFLF